MEEITKILTMESIFKDETVFTRDYLPGKLLHRDGALITLGNLTKGLLSNKSGDFSRHIMITGPTGTGKTVVSRFFGKTMEKTSELSGISRIVYRQVYFSPVANVYHHLTNLIKSLIPYFPRRGYSTIELVNILNETLEKRKLHMLIFLDNVDFYPAKVEELNNLLYHLTNSDNDYQSISLFVLSAERKFLVGLDKTTRNKLSNSIIELKPYNENEMREILNQRAFFGIKATAITQDIINLIVRATFDSKKRLDHGIHLLWKAGKVADLSERKIITAEDVQKAINKDTW